MSPYLEECMRKSNFVADKWCNQRREIGPCLRKYFLSVANVAVVATEAFSHAIALVETWVVAILT